MGSSSGNRPLRPVPAYFCSLEVENVRCFGERQRLELMDGDRPAKWTVLLGDNGVGKTTLLQCLYAMAPFAEEPRAGALAGTNPRIFPAERWRQYIRVDRDEAVLSARVHVDRNLSASTSDPHRVLEGRLALKARESSWGAYTVEEDALCFCCAYGAARHLGTGQLESRAGHHGGVSLFSPQVELINAVEWLLQADYAARSEGGARGRRRRDMIEHALIDLLPDVDIIRIAGLDEDPPRPRVEVQTPYGWVGMRDLSLGYQTMIAWVVDLASRMFDAYPESDNPLAEAAVVLVDELDLHLHPQWQRRITGYLDELFPNVQFIVTAHSPLVVQGPGRSG